jgi:hypothetical protein
MIDLHEQVIAKADHKIKAALQENNNDQYLLGLMLDDIEQIKKAMNSFNAGQMNKLYDKYENFRYYMHLLNNLAEFAARQQY